MGRIRRVAALRGPLEKNESVHSDNMDDLIARPATLEPSYVGFIRDIIIMEQNSTWKSSSHMVQYNDHRETNNTKL
jgi:hypothetical protein